MDAARVWLEFGFALLRIPAAGTPLARYADLIATGSGLAGTGVGQIPIATVTSLSELITGVNAVVMVDAVEIAVGALLGSG